MFVPAENERLLSGRLELEAVLTQSDSPRNLGVYVSCELNNYRGLMEQKALRWFFGV